MISHFTAAILFINPQVHALAPCAFELLPISTTPALKVIQHFPCNVPAFLTTDAVQLSVISRFHGTQLLEMKGMRVKSQTQRWVNVSKWTALLLFSPLCSAGGFCLAGFLPPRQIITSMHLVACSSVLWCDTANCVKYRKASVVPEEELSARVTSIYVPVLLVLVT